MSLLQAVSQFLKAFFTVPRSFNEQSVADYRAHIRMMSH